MVGDYINEDIDDGGKNRDDHGYGDVECNNKSIYEYINDLLEWNKETEKKKLLYNYRGLLLSAITYTFYFLTSLFYLIAKSILR